MCLFALLRWLPWQTAQSNNKRKEHEELEPKRGDNSMNECNPDAVQSSGPSSPRSQSNDN